MADPARVLLTAEALGRLDDGVHAEIIDGELVIESMTRFEHGDAQASIAREIKSRFGGGGPGGAGGWWIASEVTAEHALHQVYRHDLAGWRKARVPARPNGFPVKERPDWACEILSSNRRKDLVQKRQTLHARAVGDYWLVDLDAGLLTVLRHHDDAYLVVQTVSPGERARLEPFVDIELEVARSPRHRPDRDVHDHRLRAHLRGSSTLAIVRTELDFAADWSLEPSSKYKSAGSDGKDLGADIAGFYAATAGVAP